MGRQGWREELDPLGGAAGIQVQVDGDRQRDETGVWRHVEGGTSGVCHSLMEDVDKERNQG